MRFHTYQAVGQKVLLPSASDVFCAPLIICRRGNSTSQCVHITYRIDYCNSVCSRVTAIHLRRLQSILNAAARIIIQKRKYDPITATIRDVLHWLPIHQRIEFKLCELVHIVMHHTAPVYLTELCVSVSTHQGRANLHLAARGDLSVATNKGTTNSRRSFAVSGKLKWYMFSLSTTVGQFHSRLKTVNRTYYVA